MPSTPAIPALLPSSAEMRAMDERTISLGTPSLELMERAGRAVVRILERDYRSLLYRRRAVLILCGPGNNGGDGLVVHRLLEERQVRVLTIYADAKKYSQDFLINLKRCRRHVERFGGARATIGEKEALARLESASIVIDALLGTGQIEAPRGAAAALASLAAKTARPERIVVAVDTPTGINPDSGEVFDPHIPAHHTIAIECVKRGLIQFPARKAAGRIEAAGIGIATNTPDAAYYRCLTSVDRALRIPPRSGDAHKGTSGTVTVIGGAASMPGAPILSGTAALRGGAGLVKLLTFGKLHHPPEIMSTDVSALSEEQRNTVIRSTSGESDAVVLGPGLGQSREATSLMRAALDAVMAAHVPAVIDADGLNYLSSEKILHLPPTTVVTPHPGEASRLLGCLTTDVQRDRYAAARELTRRLGCVVVLKGAGTIIQSSETGYVDNLGGPELATGGSGDVLAGLIGAFLAQGAAPFIAAARAVLVHSAAGKLATGSGRVPIIAGDIIAQIPAAMAEVSQ